MIGRFSFGKFAKIPSIRASNELEADICSGKWILGLAINCTITRLIPNFCVIFVLFLMKFVCVYLSVCRRVCYTASLWSSVWIYILLFFFAAFFYALLPSSDWTNNNNHWFVSHTVNAFFKVFIVSEYNLISLQFNL